MSSLQNKIRVISTPETASDSIDATEAAQLVGYSPNETEKLIDDQYKLIQENEGGDTRPSYEHPIIRFASVALPLGALGGGALGIWFLLFAPKNNPAAEPVTSATPTPSLVPNAEGRLKSQLAFQDQQTSLEKAKSTTQTKPKKSPAKPSTQKATEPNRSPPVRRIASTEPEPPRRVYSVSAPTPVVTRTVAATQAVKPPKAPDPYTQWNTLAKLGQQQAEKITDSATSQRTVIASNSTIPMVQVGMEEADEAATERPEVVVNPMSTENTVQTDAARSRSIPSEVASPSSVRQPEFSPSDLSNPPMQIAIGTTIPAKVVVPAIATESNRERALVEITEDVPAIDNRIALPKGTLIATEIVKVDPQTHLVHQNAVAIVYRNRLGNIQQQQLPAGSLAIRGRDGTPLIAQASQKSEDHTGRDLLIATLSGVAKASEVINLPQAENVISSDSFGNTQISRRTNRQPDLLAAAIEGVLETTVDLLKQRAEQPPTARQAPILTIPKDQPVSLVFTSFFEIQR
ncbi:MULTISPECIES: hypothetical protein [Leptolyngbya]|uniref:hypothetical protein n=1 Tax=Leptolyngbya TaxID=47251 RepID=UPI0016873B67|nr:MULTISPECIES: hypothetical protein [unclassified Leptolyngbya]MBD1855542.1 hypothetical protein [Leptolyngbya sp. FACHB-1624]MBN8563581.1 hypothetical protein [Leptolyngbya sp. UWPOB_LEPTO1]